MIMYMYLIESDSRDSWLEMKFTIHDVFMNEKTQPEENLELKQNSAET